MIMTIGLEPDLKLVERLTFLQEDLGKILTHRGADSRWCRPEYITLPLLYIGQQEDDAVPEIAKIMAEVGREVSPFSMEVAGISAMPAPACPRLIEVGIASGKDCVEALHERLAKAFSMANFASDRRPYRATILLGRTVTYTDRVDLTDAIEAIGNLNFGKTDVFEMVLCGAELLDSRPVHRGLARCDFSASQ